MKNRHRTALEVVALLLINANSAPLPSGEPETAHARETTYEGTWRTTNRRLNGRMTCIVRELDDDRWNGHFYGIWQGVSFSYRVDFRGPPDKLSGKAQIDGADYVWTGSIKPGTPAAFHGSFDGSRYRGDFQLAQKSVK